MKAQKIILTIVVNTLSTDILPRLIREVADKIAIEYVSGELNTADGDSMLWEITQKPVEF